MSTSTQTSDDMVGRLYTEVRRMVAGFDIRPGERVNESRLAVRLGASRTPLREALNRLVAEGFLEVQSGQGFYSRQLTAESVFHLVEARAAIECAALSSSVVLANDKAISALVGYLDRTEPEYVRSTRPEPLVQLDEEFHARLCALADNPVLDAMLDNIAGRIRFVRLMEFRQLCAERSVARRLSAHRIVLDALVARDAETAIDALRIHIEIGREQANEIVRRAFAEIYAPKSD